MAIFDRALQNLVGKEDMYDDGDTVFTKYRGYMGEPPANKAEYEALQIDNGMLDAKIRDEITPMFAEGYTPPTWEKIQEQIAFEDVIADRIEAYPSLEDQADMAYWDRKNGTTTLDDALAAVKSKFPKP